jgi:hypothetical protein
MKHHDDPLSTLGPALVRALIAQAVNVLLAALFAAQMPGGYRVRSWAFLAALLWSVAGTVVLLVRTTGAPGRRETGSVRAGRIALWLISSWLWPILVRRRRSTSREQPSR